MMTSAIVHRTPGLIDVRAFTTMGLSAKPNSTNPIGQFGTGLKYAISTLVRLGAEPVVWIGRDKYTFRSVGGVFRGQDYIGLVMEHLKWGGLRVTKYTLPFTTNYGKFWKPWMAFRELEANTRDEGGETLLMGEVAVSQLDHHPSDNTTLIVIEHPEYVGAWELRDDTFLPGGLSEREGSEGLQVFTQPSQRVYYRGLRAMDVEKPTKATYNVLTDVELTEDRTIKYPFQVRHAIGAHLLTSEDEELIRSVVTCDKSFWEFNLEFPNWMQPGDTFRRVAESRPRGMWHSVGTYYGAHDARPHITPEYVMGQHPRPWRVLGTSIYDANNKQIMEQPFGFAGRWELLAEELIKRLRFGEKGATPEEMVSDEMRDEPEDEQPIGILDPDFYMELPQSVEDLLGDEF